MTKEHQSAPVTAERTGRGSTRASSSAHGIDCVEEWGTGSFPASDPPQSWSYEPERDQESASSTRTRRPAH